MTAFEKWLVNEYPKVLPKGRIGKAISYTYNIYHKQNLYHLDGRLKMDNNLAENAIRLIALGRKNWRFCSNQDTAENAAIIYSMMACCREHGVNFRQWMEFFWRTYTDTITITAKTWQNYFRTISKIKVTSFKNSNSPMKMIRELLERSKFFNKNKT